MKLFYIANHQLPTTKAHGLQIMKMCEAFSEQGLECELIIPIRGIDPNIQEIDPFKFYGVKETFRITRLSSFDFIKFGGSWLGKQLFWLQQLSFGHSARRYLKGKEGVIYSRDPFSLYMLLKTDYKLYWEAHNFPKNINAKFYKKIIKRISGLIVITEALKYEFSRFYRGQILVASDAVDIEEFNIDISKEDARMKLGLPKDKKIAMYVGHLYKWKGVDVLIKSTRFLKDDEMVVVVGGLKDDRDSLYKDIPKGSEDKVRFISYISHDLVPAYLKSADCLVLTGKSSEVISRQYTSPLKLFEYMATKRPIVAQNLLSFREILNSNNAILVEPDNERALARGIQSGFYDQELTESLIENTFESVKDRTWINRARLISDYFKWPCQIQ